ncbi:MAG: alpha/beta fold hydrolase [Candidatus Nanopelagicales bacterium]
MKHKLRFTLVLLVLTVAIGPFFVPFSTSGTLSEREALKNVLGMSDTYLTSLNHRIHFESEGDENADSVIILLHGFGASSFSFEHVIEDLAKDSFVIAYDRAAFGFTERPLAWQDVNPYSFDGQLIVLDDVVSTFGKNKEITLIGHSAGASLALEYSIRNPLRVKNLVLVAPAISGDGAYPGWIRPLFSIPQVRHLGPILVSTIATSGLQILYDSYFDQSKITKATLNGYTAPLQVKNWERAFWEFVTAPRGEPAPIEELKARTLIVTGDNDVIVPTQVSIQNAAKVKNVAELIVMKDTGHLPHEENPDDFVKHILEFLKGDS